MGMFYNKLMESAVEEVIQTPDDIGVDLDAIEKNIVGDDGCEAHREEIDDAMEGVVGDPMEEAATIMYESEYNFNQLLKCIGMAELNEMAAGRDFVLEAGSENSKSFWEKTKQLFINMFKAITEAFQNVIAKMTNATPNDKKFVDANEEIIKKGAAASTRTFKGYKFSNLMQLYIKKESKLQNKFDAAVKDPNWSKDSDKEIANTTLISNVLPSGLHASDAGEFTSKLKEHFFVEEEYTGDKAVATVLQILKRNDDIKRLREAYADLKAQYNELFKYLKQMQGSYDKKTEEGAKASSVCIAYISAYKYEKNLQNTYFTTVLKAHKTARAQARHMAMAWYNEGKGTKNEKPKANGVNESSLFNITII